jgi:hypothetical protein
MTELTDEQWTHLADMLFQKLTDNMDFRAGVALGLANEFTLDQYEEFLEEVSE